jgi:hypothetical protein
LFEFGGERKCGQCKYGECAICLEPVMNRTVLDLKIMTLSCGHSYHYGCLGAWMKTQHNCPICRAEIIS